ncbi:MAG: dephospho-CoA kinase [Burkholderiaceae bacterium]|nr:MAG: dephospho-CoA kinase [Burkholderiaceae bacterium]TAM01454.1 MAG: dephospho-CoA kinase [Pusillimonas sp.]
MYKIGLTGGIGSGKSCVASFFQGWGAAVIDTDVIAHELTAPAGAAIAPLVAAFGPDVVTPEGALDRSVVRDLVFHDPAARHKLESILHPMIGRVTQERTEQATGCYLVYVVPLLVESGRWRGKVDRICVVDCDPATQVARVRARSGLTPEAIARIMSAQVSREARLEVADDIVLNGAGTTLAVLAARARAVHETWCMAARQKKAVGTNHSTG